MGSMSLQDTPHSFSSQKEFAHNMLRYPTGRQDKVDKVSGTIYISDEVVNLDQSKGGMCKMVPDT
jgi:hypothetical protein